MKNIFLTLMTIFIAITLCNASEIPDFGDLYLQKYEKTADQPEFLAKLNNFDISEKIGGYLTGVLGKKYKKIDLFLGAEKDKKEDNLYIIKGLRRLGNDIKPIAGTMQVIKVSKEFRLPETEDQKKSVNVIYLKYKFDEFDNGAIINTFYGYASLVDFFDRDTKRPNNVRFASDFYLLQKMLVGKKVEKISGKKEKCIFSLDVCCGEELPYSHDLYYYKKGEDDFPRVKPKFDNPEWHNDLKPHWVDEYRPTR